MDSTTLGNVIVLVLAAVVVYRLVSTTVLPLPSEERKQALISLWPKLLLILVVVLAVVLSPLYISVGTNIFHQK